MENQFTPREGGHYESLESKRFLDTQQHIACSKYSNNVWIV